ncbi:hypothetical protein MSAN_02300400 [Mycena sanguinolenta]|uniref:Uncharacterized protein n=1 Tax=Mycena sanguinolenta TaxID=230812 RepID=A0A8H7CHT1_9AGAR|nr:hypothetical protein MSAN_02300400 [Mycena sanguinolenta]
MARRAYLTIFYTIGIAAVVVPVLVTVFHSATDKKLLSLITANTPISGFYGPGSWWAWLITLGMTHAHSFVATAEPEEWDYDLIAVSGYIVAAAIDLTLKARAIGKLGESACGSPLLPALFCAERVVWVGSGSSLFTIATATFVGRSRGLRRVATALIPLFFIAIALRFTSVAHHSIFGTHLNSPCMLSDGSMLRHKDISPGFPLADLPLLIIPAIEMVPKLYRSPDFWLGFVPFPMLLAVIILDDENHRLIAMALFPVLPVILVVVIILALLAISVIVSPLVYILAFFPETGSFPLTGMSVKDMDQLAALLGVGFIAALRSGTQILKALGPAR